MDTATVSTRLHRSVIVSTPVQSHPYDVGFSVIVWGVFIIYRYQLAALGAGFNTIG